MEAVLDIVEDSINIELCLKVWLKENDCVEYTYMCINTEITELNLQRHGLFYIIFFICIHLY